MISRSLRCLDWRTLNAATNFMEDRGLTKPIDPLKASAAGITEKVTGENSMLLAETIKLAQAMPHGFSGLMKRFEDKGLPKVFARFAPRVAAKV